MIFFVCVEYVNSLSRGNCHRSFVKRTDMSSVVVSRRMRSDLCVVNSSTRPPFSVKPINLTKMYISD